MSGTTPSTIFLTDPMVVHFYHDHPHLDPNACNRLLCELLTLSMTTTNPNQTILENTAMMTKLATLLSDLPTQLAKESERQLDQFEKNMTKQQQESNEKLLLHFQNQVLTTQDNLHKGLDNLTRDFKYLMMEDVNKVKHGQSSMDSLVTTLSTQFQHIVLQNEQKISASLDTMTKEFKLLFLEDAHKTQSNAHALETALNHVVTQTTTQEKQIHTTLDTLVREFHQFVADKANQVHSGADTLETFTSTVLSQLTSMMTQTVAHSEQRLATNMATLQEVVSKCRAENEHLATEVGEWVRRMDNSSSKGRIGERMLLQVLTNLIPRTTIEDVSANRESGDFMFCTENRPKILIENKTYTAPVPEAEVAKFIRDVTANRCSGLFLSQTSPIASKENFEINFHEGHVLVYIHNVKNDADIIRLGIQLIHQLQPRLMEMTALQDSPNSEEQTFIAKEVLDAIYKEYQQWLTKKAETIRVIKQRHKELLVMMNEFDIPELTTFLQKYYAFPKALTFPCTLCSFVATSKQSFGGHMRWNHDIDIDAKPAAAAAGNATTDDTSETDEPIVSQENTDTFTIPIVEPKKPARRMGNRKTTAK